MADILGLTKRQVSHMSRAELISLLFDWINQAKERYIMMGMRSQARDRIKYEVAHYRDIRNEELNTELIEVKKQLEDLQTQTIPPLKQKTEELNLVRDELSLQVKQYKKQVTELKNSLRELEKTSKVQLQKALARKKRALSEILPYKEKVEVAEAQTNKLKLEIVRKNNELTEKNNELWKEKDKVRTLDAKIYKQQKQIERMEEQIKKLEKKIKHPNEVTGFEKTREEFEARVELTKGLIVEAREEKKLAVRRLLKKDKQVNELLQQQAQVKEPVVILRKSYQEANYTWTIKELRERNKALNAQMKVCSEIKQKNEELIKNLTNTVMRLKKLYYSEKMKHEDLKESLKSSGIKLDADGVVAHRPDRDSNTQIAKEKYTFLPPIVESPVPKREASTFPIRENSILGKPKSQPARNAENLSRQRLSAPPATRKPPTVSAARKNIFFLTETDDRAAETQPRRSNSAVPSLRVKRNP